MSNVAKANPAFETDLASVLAAADAEGLTDHVLFQTSGTEDSPKWVALSQEALECSAAAVNARFEVGLHDVWLRVLGDYHVGGYGIEVRGALTGATVRELGGRWSPAKCLRSLKGATLCSLVPTQLYDLVQLRARPPGSLRAVLVGGAALSPELREEALRLRWPVHDAYGMTEAGSTVAVDGELLPIWEARLGQGGLLQLRGEALFSAYLIDGDEGWHYHRPFDADGWFASSDKVALEGRRISVLGRSGDEVQVLGENVDLGALQSVIEGLGGQGCAVAAVADARSGKRLLLVCEHGAEIDRGKLLDDYNGRVAGFERVTECIEVAVIPKTALGKVRRGELDQMLENSRLA